MKFIELVSLNNKKIEEKDYVFFDTVYNSSKSEEIYKELDEFFDENVDPWKYRYSYFRWYTILMWNKLFQISENDFLNKIVGKQIPEAIYLNFSVLKQIVGYLRVNALYREDAERIFDRIQEHFFKSDAVIGYRNEKKYTMNDLITDLSDLKSKGDSLKEAEFIGSLQKIIPKDDLSVQYFSINPKTLDSLLEVVEFFVILSPGEIWKVLENIDYREVSWLEIKKIISEEPRAINGEKKVGFSEIKTQTEQKFKKDSNGQFENVIIVLNELDKLATDNNDDRIRELYYFNEQTGKFEWNETLLKE